VSVVVVVVRRHRLCCCSAEVRVHSLSAHCCVLALTGRLWSTVRSSAVSAEEERAFAPVREVAEIANMGLEDDRHRAVGCWWRQPSCYRTASPHCRCMGFCAFRHSALCVCCCVQGYEPVGSDSDPPSDGDTSAPVRAGSSSNRGGAAGGGDGPASGAWAPARRAYNEDPFGGTELPIVSPLSPASSGGDAPPSETEALLMEFGHSLQRVRAALKRAGGNPDVAAEDLMSGDGDSGGGSGVGTGTDTSDLSALADSMARMSLDSATASSTQPPSLPPAVRSGGSAAEEPTASRTASGTASGSSSASSSAAVAGTSARHTSSLPLLLKTGKKISNEYYAVTVRRGDVPLGTCAVHISAYSNSACTTLELQLSDDEVKEALSVRVAARVTVSRWCCDCVWCACCWFDGCC
jgi:hypothetical protein